MLLSTASLLLGLFVSISRSAAPVVVEFVDLEESEAKIYKYREEGDGYACRNRKGWSGKNDIALAKLLKTRKGDCGRFDGANLDQTDLKGAALQGAELNSTNMSEVNLKGAQLRSAEVNYAILLDANMAESNAEHANFVAARLDRANLKRAKLKGANFVVSSIVGAYLVEADLDGAVMNGADGKDAKIGKSTLKRLVARGADFQGASFGASNLEWADFYRANLKKPGLPAQKCETRTSSTRTCAARIWNAPTCGTPTSAAPISEAPRLSTPIWITRGFPKPASIQEPSSPSTSAKPKNAGCSKTDRIPALEKECGHLPQKECPASLLADIY